MGNPTRFPNGVSTAAAGSNLGNFPLPDPTEVYSHFDDFNTYRAAEWTVTNTTTHATIGTTAGAGGLISLAGGASSVTSDIAAIQQNPADINFTTTQQVWFYTAIKATTALNDQLMVGIMNDISTLAPTDGIYFNKAAASTSIDLVIRKASTSTTQSAVATLANNTIIELGFYYNGKDAVDVFVNETKVASVTTLTNLPAAVALSMGLGVKAAATAPTTANIVSDFILASQSRAY